MNSLSHNFAKSKLGLFFLQKIINSSIKGVALKIIYENEYVVAFHHPKPSYETHVLIVPKIKLENIVELADHPEISSEIFKKVKAVVQKLKLDHKSYRVIVNSGEYQDVKQVHFHLVT